VTSEQTGQELEKQAKEFAEASQKLMTTMMDLSEQKGRLEGMRLTGAPDDVKMLRDQLKVVIKAISEVLQWLIKLSLLNMTANQLLVQVMMESESK
jgi:hypothetical protein